jgi:F-type H+-transporting ATPase subunit b
VINLDLTFVIQIINFLILLTVLNIFLYKPIRKAIADRTATVDGAKARAEAVDLDVQEKVALYEARLREAKAKAGEERGVLKAQALAEEATVLEKARKEAGDSLATIKETVAREAAQARTALQEQARFLSKDICEKVLGRSF